MKLKIMGCLLMVAVVTEVWAQGGSRSPYSQFGIGTLSDRSQSMSRGMNGVGFGLHESDMVNTLNPASYSSVDSLTMLFDMGLSGQLTHFEEGNVKRNSSMANFEYAVASFRLMKDVGVAVGILPFSNVGYNYSTTTKSLSTGTLTENYSGSGGTHEVMLGVGWHVLKPLSIGVNAGYFWGTIDRTVSPSASSASNTLTKTYSTSISSYKLDFGAQWEQRIGRRDWLTIGAVFGLGHNLKNEADMMIVSRNSASNANDTAKFTVADATTLPMSLGVGVAYQHAGKLTLAADFSLEKWGSEKLPDYVNGRYELQSGMTLDRKKVNIGLDWTPNPLGRTFTDHIHYRLGAGYATPYYKINGQDGPRELSASLGVSLPIINNRSVLHISGQWVNSQASGFITDNTFRLNIGITFNERWFMKWTVD